MKIESLIDRTSTKNLLKRMGISVSLLQRVFVSASYGVHKIPDFTVVAFSIDVPVIIDDWTTISVLGLIDFRSNLLYLRRDKSEAEAKEYVENIVKKIDSDILRIVENDFIKYTGKSKIVLKLQ